MGPSQRQKTPWSNVVGPKSEVRKGSQDGDLAFWRYREVERGASDETDRGQQGKGQTGKVVGRIRAKAGQETRGQLLGLFEFSRRRPQ